MKLLSFLAAQDEVVLDKISWFVIDMLRDYYLKYATFPLQLKVIAKVAQKFNLPNPSSELFLRFSMGGPLLQGARYAGLPKPENCIDWNFSV